MNDYRGYPARLLPTLACQKELLHHNNDRREGYQDGTVQFHWQESVLMLIACDWILHIRYTCFGWCARIIKPITGTKQVCITNGREQTLVVTGSPPFAATVSTNLDNHARERIYECIKTCGRLQNGILPSELRLHAARRKSSALLQRKP